MSENLFDDIGFDLVEKIVPPSLPNNIIGKPVPAPIPIQTTPSTSGTTPSRSGNKTGLIILGVLVVAFVGYKIWENKRKKDAKKQIR
jgi:hypothetical protein